MFFIVLLDRIFLEDRVIPEAESMNVKFRLGFQA